MSRRAKVDWTQEDYNITHSVPIRGRENELETQNPHQESHRTQQGHRDRNGGQNRTLSQGSLGKVSYLC